MTSSFAEHTSRAEMFPPKLLDIPDALKNRLNTNRFSTALPCASFQGCSASCQCFRKLCGRTHWDEDEHASTIISSRMLLCTSAPLLTSLLKMKRDERTCCVNMFNHVLRWTSLTNNNRDASERDQTLNQIYEIAGRNPNRIDELCLQILKQTRGQTNRMEERNTWRLFTVILDNMTPSIELLRFLIGYFQSVKARVAEDPFVRRVASEMIKKLMAILPPDAEERERPLSLLHMCERTYSCDVFLMDGTCQKVIYDAHTLVEHVIPQAAWAIGLEECKTFGLFELWGDKHLRLNTKRHLTTVVNSPRFLDGCGQERSRLLMKKKIIRSLEDEKKDCKGFDLTYSQSKIQYLKGGYPLEDIKAVRMCALLIQIERPIVAFEGEGKLSEAVEEFIPQTCFCRKDLEEWMVDVKEELKQKGHTSDEVSRFQFLDDLQQLPYGNCEFYHVETVKCSTKPSPIPKHTPVLLGTNRTGVHFIQIMPHKWLHTIDLIDIQECAVKDRGVWLKAKEMMTKPSYSLTTEAGEEICRTVNRYVQHFVKRMQTSERLQKDSMMEAGSDATSSPSSALDWNAYRLGNLSDGHDPLTSVEELSQTDVTRNLDTPGPSRQRLLDDREESSYSVVTVARSDASSQPSSGSRPSRSSGGEFARGSLRQVRQVAKKTVTRVCNGTKRSHASKEQTSQTSHLSLRPGEILNNMYELMGPAESRDPLLITAINMYCHTKVLLKFCTTKESFDKAKTRHRIRENRDHICRLLRPVEEETGGSPYLAFECGDETLEQWMARGRHSEDAKLKVAFEVCRLLRTLHNENVVHGDLKPSNVHYFASSDSWRLLETDRASASAELSPILYTLEYTAPEMLDAEEKNEESIMLTPKYDIFSLGIILYEILFEKKFYPRTLRKEDIRARLREGNFYPDMTSVPSLSAREIVDGCLQLNPVHRWTAVDLCESELFATIKEQSQHSVTERRMDKILELCRMNVEEALSANMEITIGMEELPVGDGPSNAAANRNQSVLTMTEEVLGGEIVFLLNVKRRYRLRINVRHHRINKTPFRKVEWVRVKPPDANPIELSMEESQTTECQLESTALFDTVAFNSVRMNTVPKAYGNPNEKYLPLDIVIGVRLGMETSGEENSILQLKGRIYCKMHAENDQMRYFRLARSIRDGWYSTPRWVRFTIKSTALFGDVVVGSLISI